MRKHLKLMARAQCQTCPAELPLERHPNRKFCESCGKARQLSCQRRSVEKTGCEAAYAVMRLAIRLGLLAHPKNFSCVDCGMPAKCYDHRDYNKPLDVDPVCYTCNKLRGGARPFVKIDDAYAAAGPEERRRIELLMHDAAIRQRYGHGVLDGPIFRSEAIALGLIEANKKVDQTGHVQAV